MIGPILGGRAMLRFDPDRVAITGDGNSIMYGDGVGASQNLTAQLAALAPINGAIAITNLGINGQRTTQMTSNAADVNAAYVAGKTNVLLVLEGFNDMIGGGVSAAQAFENMRLYCQARLATNTSNPWRIVLMTCTAYYGGDSQSQGSMDNWNGKIDAYNALIRAGKATLGYTALVDTRSAGSPFNLPDYTPASFKNTNYSKHFRVETDNKLLHPNAYGYGVLAAMVADTLRRLPAR